MTLEITRKLNQCSSGNEKITCISRHFKRNNTKKKSDLKAVFFLMKYFLFVTEGIKSQQQTVAMENNSKQGSQVAAGPQKLINYSKKILLKQDVLKIICKLMTTMLHWQTKIKAIKLHGFLIRNKVSCHNIHEQKKYIILKLFKQFTLTIHQKLFKIQIFQLEN